MSEKLTQTAHDLAALLAQLAMNIKDRYYKDKTIFLDGYTFTNCCFHKCTLVTDTGAFALNSCTIIDCTTQYGPNAARIIRLFNLYNRSNVWQAFNPEVTSNGAVTIR